MLATSLNVENNNGDQRKHVLAQRVPCGRAFLGHHMTDICLWGGSDSLTVFPDLWNLPEKVGYLKVHTPL